MCAFARKYCRTVFIVLAAINFTGPGAFCDAPNDSAARQLAGIEKRAEQGYIADQLKLGAAYLTGRGAPQNLAQSAHWFQRAAGLGNPEAQNIIAYFYQHGIGVRQDLSRAVSWYEMASAGGLPAARVNLGVLFLHGDGVRQSYSTARSYFERAAEKGSGLGAAYRGDMEFLAIGGPRNVAEAEKWYVKGVRLHDPVSAYDLAFLYSGVPDHPRNLPKAAGLLRDAAHQGFAPAKHALGYLLVNHPELEPSGQEARGMLEEASDAGLWKASILLGVLARDGNHTPASPSQAYYYLHLAALQGGDKVRGYVQNELDRLTPKLSEDDRATAETRAETAYQRRRATMIYRSADSGSWVMVDITAAGVLQPTDGGLPGEVETSNR